MRHKSFVVVISGPSGVGKTTVVRRVMQGLDGLWLSVSMTSRPPRPGETNGVDYIFVSEKEFQRLIRENHFLEWNAVFDHHYGTPAQPVKEHLARGADVVLEIDVQGGLRVKEALGQECVCVFLAPPSQQSLQQRLRKRGTEDPEVIRSRLERAAMELETGQRYDYIVVNDQLETAVRDVMCIIRAERCSKGRRI